jgi:serine/threonine protein kinase
MNTSLLQGDGLEMGELAPQPEFDSEEGFPINASARAQCARQWTSNCDLHHGAVGSAKVSYADLQMATRNFDGAHKIGDGGSSMVYKGQLYGVPCAIKQLSPDGSGVGVSQFASEVDVLTQIKHDHICQLFACSTNGPSRCLVLELMDISLEDRLQAQPPLRWEQRLYIALCICRSIAYLHAHSPPIIHRDIKSSNVLLNGFETSDAIDEASQAKLCDFGTARIDDGMSEGGMRTSKEQIIGTKSYMPPEYLRGRISAKTDAYAFGILVIELLTDLRPQDAREVADSYTDLKARTNRLRECAKENGWVGTKGARTTMSEIAAHCTSGSATRRTPMVVLAALEGAYNNGTFVPRGGTLGRAFRRLGSGDPTS